MKKNERDRKRLIYIALAIPIFWSFFIFKKAPILEPTADDDDNDDNNGNGGERWSNNNDRWTDIGTRNITNTAILHRQKIPPTFITVVESKKMQTISTTKFEKNI